MSETQTTAFYEYLTKRENIRLARLAGKPRAEWTDDPILQKYKFTNVKRKYDRTSVGLAAIYAKNIAGARPGNVLLNCSAYRYFGTVETARRLGWLQVLDVSTLTNITAIETSFAVTIRELTDHVSLAGEKLFTGAYIVPNCGDTRQKHVIVSEILGRIAARAHVIATNAMEADSWRVMVESLCENYGVGAFMAKEIVLDFIAATAWSPRDWQTWTPVGPGARRGAARVLSEDGRLVSPASTPNALGVCLALHTCQQELWSNSYERLDLTDIQFGLCEFDKYSRALLGEGKPKSVFKPTDDVITRGTIS